MFATVGRPGLVAVAAYVDNASRHDHRNALKTDLEAALAARAADE